MYKCSYMYEKNFNYLYLISYINAEMLDTHNKYKLFVTTKFKIPKQFMSHLHENHH